MNSEQKTPDEREYERIRKRLLAEGVAPLSANFLALQEIERRSERRAYRQESADCLPRIAAALERIATVMEKREVRKDAQARISLTLDDLRKGTTYDENT